MLVRPGDLTPYARIRNAALEGFAARGVRGTSIRDVAEAAGVSAGLVQHHFGTKAGLRAAVDEYVTAVAAELFGEVDVTRMRDPFAEFGDLVTGLITEAPAVLLYVARSAVENDEEGQAIFRGFVSLARRQFDALAADDRLAAGLDLDWATLHVVIWTLATLLLQGPISAVLGGEFARSPQLERWNVATAELFRAGFASSR